MNFEMFLEQAWKEHAADPQAVAEDLMSGAMLIQNDKHVVDFAALLTHVMGEHMGMWDEGVQALKYLIRHNTINDNESAKQSIRRSIAVLELGQKERNDVKDFSPSDQVQILGTAASALAGQKHLSRALEFFREGIKVADSGALAEKDPAFRALAVAGNNLACTLEELEARTPEQNELMLLAAQTGRRFWEIAGTWLHVERAEYRLAMSHLKAALPEKALEHGRLCLAICEKNQAPALEFFFGWEAIAHAAAAMKDAGLLAEARTHVQKYFESISPDERAWAEDTLKKVTALA